MDQINSTSFSITEEAFLPRSLKEVVNVWARGCGQATFNLEILDGGADLKLGFQLGRPSDPHLLPEQNDQLHQLCPHHVDLPHDHAGVEHQHPHRRRHKGPKQRARDRARAAKHHASRKSAATAVPAVLLPFRGRLLPLNGTSPAVATPAASSNTAVPAATPTPPASYPPAFAGPKKDDPSNFQPSQVVNSVKKNLFAKDPPVPRQQIPPDPGQPEKDKNYKLKEEDLWTKLFTL